MGLSPGVRVVSTHQVSLAVNFDETVLSTLRPIPPTSSGRSGCSGGRRSSQGPARTIPLRGILGEKIDGSGKRSLPSMHHASVLHCATTSVTDHLEEQGLCPDYMFYASVSFSTSTCAPTREGLLPSGSNSIVRRCRSKKIRRKEVMSLLS